MKILVVGDILIDRYITVSTCRKSQESDLPVYDVLSGEEVLGGAAHVAATIRSLDPENDHEVYLAGIMDDRFVCLTEAAQIHAIYGDGRSLIKTRFHTEDNKIVFRADEGLKFDPAKVEAFVQLFEEQVDEVFDLLVVSDYDKGTITERFVQKLRKISKTKIVDSKRRDLTIFSGFDVLNINQQEYGEQGPNVESLFGHVVVTKGAEGAELRFAEKLDDNRYVVHVEQFPSVKRQVVDVTGCGDVHTAATALCLAENLDLRSAISYANGAAGRAVTQFGTSRTTV